MQGERTVLLYLQANPRAWGVLEVEGGGAVGPHRRIPIVTAAERERPALLRFEPGMLRLAWPGGGETP
jgi:hypothetical protein